jgi:Centromere DNA-binding protein complex CBF3 subunit, domain 2
MRKVAGHVHQGRYFIDRAQITPPEELLCQIFPQAVKDLELMKRGVYHASLSGQGFLEIMKYMRTIFLQNSILLRERFSEYPNFNTPLFRHPFYALFAAEIKAACDNPEIRMNEQLHIVAPAIKRKLNGIRVKQHTAFKRSDHIVGKLNKRIISSQNR